MDKIKDIKVGIISCSGEEIPEGEISRLATRLVLEKLRPDNTVTICLPLFIAGGEEERYFTSIYPSITIDGCDKLCAKFATEKFSGKVEDYINIKEIMKENNMSDIKNQTNEEKKYLVEITAEKIAEKIDKLIENYLERMLRKSKDGSGRCCCEGH